ncbi:hypothetical protein LRQ11_15835 [Pseudomonas sp. MAFF 311095]|nr:hypothetical protein [Pseudomonas petroselini]MCD7080221.1 hypothetical protein [Pseudomonas petroselini]
MDANKENILRVIFHRAAPMCPRTAKACS